MLAGLLLIALAAVSWGTTGSVTTILVQRHGAEPLVIGLARIVVAAALLLSAARLGGASLRLARADLGRCLLMGACMAAFQAAYFTAVVMTGIAVTALLAICSAPLMIAMLAAAVLGERLTVRIVAALGLGVGGTVLLVAGPAGLATGPRLAGGAGLALTAGLAYALYVITAKVSLARSTPLPLTGLSFTAAALVTLPVLTWSTAPLEQLARGWPWLLYLGGVTTAGAYAAYTSGLRRVPATVAGVVTLLEPLTATLLGVLAFGEPLGALGGLGALALLGAIALLGFRLNGTGSAARRPG
ncbi:MAG TPA: EamA family transporter [Methylomirabilota bacterium]|nr:EamA family transporter [Methylomirabilota bacterium]